MIGLLSSPSAEAKPRQPGTPAAPVFTNASVHDPDVVRTVGQYYTFGSHLAAASPDLMQWTQLANGVNPANPLFEDVTTELKKTLDWAQSDTLWAPDAIQLADGRFYMYYNACKGDSRAPPWEWRWPTRSPGRTRTSASCCSWECGTSRARTARSTTLGCIPTWSTPMSSSTRRESCGWCTAPSPGASSSSRSTPPRGSRSPTRATVSTVASGVSPR